MKPSCLILSILLLFSVFGFSQSVLPKNSYLKVAGGRVIFGTGDVAGSGISIEGARNIIKRPMRLVNRLLLGVEANFEHGVRNIVALNPTPEEFLRSFRHVSNMLLFPKLTYYPFKGVAQGFNIAAGPSVGYSYQSHESQWSGQPTASGDYIRYSVLTNSNTWLLGFRISTGYEWLLTSKVLAGARLDFSNYTNGDINTLAAVKVGLRW